MKISRSFLMMTTIAAVGFLAGPVVAQPMTLTPATPAPPGQPIPVQPPAATTPATPAAPMAAPAQPAPPAPVDPRLSYRPGDAPIRLMLGGMAGERLEAMDTDGDGRITAAEFQAAAEAFFTRLDTNGDGVLDDADRREPAVVEGGDARPVPDRGEVDRRVQEFRGGMMGPNGGMMIFPGGPMFYGMPGMWFFMVPMGPQGGPGFQGGPMFQVPMPGPGGGDGGPNFEFRMGPGGQGGGQWFYWEGPERRRD